MTRPCGAVSHARMGGTRRPLRCRGGRPVSPCPIDPRLWRCMRSGTHHRFRPLGRTCVVGWLFSAPGGVLVSVVGRPVRKPPERRARAPVCKAARGSHRQVQGCTRRAPVRRGLWPGACGVLAAGARARRAEWAGCVPRSREAGSRQSDSTKQAKRLEHHDIVTFA